MHDIDPSLCASLLRGFTDELLASREPGLSNLSLEETIRSIRLVSNVAAKKMRECLFAYYPEIGWEKEEIEGPSKRAVEAHWIYDPIDGAYHYLQQLPLWSSSLALVVHGETMFALVYDPVTHELYAASRGAGATLNGLPLQVSSKHSLEPAVLGTAVPPRRAAAPDEHAQSLAQLEAIAEAVFVVRPMASASLQLAYVAAGRLDGYWEVGHDVNDWLAGALLVKEAGGRVTSFRTETIGLEVEGIVAAPKTLHPAIRDIVVREGSRVLDEQRIVTLAKSGGSIDD